MTVNQNSTTAHRAAVSWLDRQMLWRNLMRCQCSARQIRRHLLIAVLLVWLLLVVAMISVWNTG
jgi:hypothetical protein